MGGYQSSAQSKTWPDDHELEKSDETLALPQTSQGHSRSLPVLKHKWRESFTWESVDRNPPMGGWYRYKIGTLHCPVQHQFLDKALNTPWFAEFELSVVNLEVLSRGEFPWRANHNKSCEDRISVRQRASHWAIPGKPMYRRAIRLDCRTEETSQEGHQTLEWEWRVGINIWSESADWLVHELTYPKLGRLLSKETTVNTWAVVRDNEYEPLADNKMFFNKYHGIKQSDNMNTSLTGSSLANHLNNLKPCLKADEPGFCQIVEEHFWRQNYNGHGQRRI